MLCLDEAMPKRVDISVKIDVETYRKLRTVAAWKGVRVNEFLTQVVDPIMDRELSKMAKEVSKGQKEDE